MPDLTAGLALALQFVRAARHNLDAASLYVDQDDGPSGPFQVFSREFRMRSLNRIFNIDKFPKPLPSKDLQPDLQDLSADEPSVRAALVACGGRRRSNPTRFNDKNLAYTNYGGFFRGGQFRFHKSGGKMRLDSIFICEPFLKHMNRVDNQALIHVHELAHFVGHPEYIDDHAYNTNPTKMNNLAAESAGAQRRALLELRVGRDAPRRPPADLSPVGQVVPPAGKALPKTNEEEVRMTDVTQLLHRIKSGDRRAGEDLLPIVYEELRRLAQHKLDRELPGQTLQATALVHEAYLRLGGTDAKWDGRGHFFAAAAEAMRRILVERARQKRRIKHGGQRQRVELDAAAIADDRSDDVLAIDQVLDQFAEKHPAKAELVKLRYFVGLTNREAADVLGISTSTADRHWAFARAWLFRELAQHVDTS